MNRETVIRQRPAMIQERNGNQRPDWTTTTDLTIGDVSIAPEWVTEVDNGGRAGRPGRWQMYGPHGIDVTGGDRIVCTAGTFEVDGTPAQWESRFGQLGGSVTHLERIEG